MTFDKSLPDCNQAPFWRTKKLKAMSHQEWESLCDGCGKCCLNKIEDNKTGKIFQTNGACRLLDLKTCRCTDYRHRKKRVPNCVQLSPDLVKTLSWLPRTCAYRLLGEGKDLPDWHPLRAGDDTSVPKAKVSVKGEAVGEMETKVLNQHLVDWEDF